MDKIHRRSFVRSSLLAGSAWALSGLPQLTSRAGAQPAENAKPGRISDKGNRMAFGLVTYLWGQNWTLDELIDNCEKAHVYGVELRTTHKHGVEPSLSTEQRMAVAQRFADSRVTLVGLGSNERFDHPDPAALRQAIETTKAFVRLSHDVGGSGVKVKPDRFYPDVPREKTIEQIGRSLNEVAAYAEGFGQQIRLEVHGQCAELPTIKAILDVADHPSVAVCWNSNAQDLQGKGLKYNFDLVAKRLGATCHVRELDSKDYPYQELIQLLVDIDYEGWVMLESSSKPEDPVAALAAQGRLFQTMVRRAQG